jgi:hypothetical protein
MTHRSVLRMQGTHRWEVAEGEDAEQTGLPAGTVANDNQLSAPSLAFGPRGGRTGGRASN